MAFPFSYSSEFSSVDYPNYWFRRVDFHRLRKYLNQKFPELKKSAVELEFVLTSVFGFLNFTVRVKQMKGKVRYTIDMTQVLLGVVLFLFISLFMVQGSVMKSLSLGFFVLLVVYVCVLLIVNGMVRQVFESFVKEDMFFYEKGIIEPLCIICHMPLKKGQTICYHCEKNEQKPKPIQIKYTFTSEKEK